MTNLIRSSAFCHFWQPFVTGRIDKSLVAQVADSTLLLSPLSLFSQDIIQESVFPPEPSREKKERLVTKVGDETLASGTRDHSPFRRRSEIAGRAKRLSKSYVAPGSVPAVIWSEPQSSCGADTHRRGLLTAEKRKMEADCNDPLSL
jgi:hypothetical protein